MTGFDVIPFFPLSQTKKIQLNMIRLIGWTRRGVPKCLRTSALLCLNSPCALSVATVSFKHYLFLLISDRELLLQTLHCHIWFCTVLVFTKLWTFWTKDFHFCASCRVIGRLWLGGVTVMSFLSGLGTSTESPHCFTVEQGPVPIIVNKEDEGETLQVKTCFFQGQFRDMCL